MHKLSFFPLGNADTTLIELGCGKNILFDFASVANPLDSSEKRSDVAKELREIMKRKVKTSFEVVAFSHGDNDHVKGAGDFFHLDHAAVYQGGDRYKIDELWVPANMILEDGCEDDARIIRQEARHRLRKGYGIQVFSRPKKLKAWLESNGLTLESRAHLITDAGTLARGLNLATDGVEFFAHSPFAHRQDENTVIDRNGDCLVMQATFDVYGIKTRLLLLGDAIAEPLDDLVGITRYHQRDERLTWDVCHVAHHCSAYSLNAQDKGETITQTTENIAWLYGNRGNGAIMVCPSDPIPSVDTTQPPHFQAANYYKKRLGEVIGGKFLVTMSEPTSAKPKKIEIEIGIGKAKHLLTAVVGGAAMTDRPGPRVG
jgi:beta-lactamase superfamily II metal-dependent hydrolase